MVIPYAIFVLWMGANSLRPPWSERRQRNYMANMQGSSEFNNEPHRRSHTLRRELHAHPRLHEHLEAVT